MENSNMAVPAGKSLFLIGHSTERDPDIVTVLQETRVPGTWSTAVALPASPQTYYYP